MDQHTAPVASQHGMRNVLIVVVILALGVLAFLNYRQRVDLEQQLSKISIRENNQVGSPQNVEAAKRIVERVKKHYAIPGNVDPTVATIVDVETLKARNDFSNLAKNGDHLVITPTRAVLYDPDRDIIVDVVPVQLTPQQPAPSSSASSVAK